MLDDVHLTLRFYYSKMTTSNHYQAYLIRLQWVGGRLHWQASLENVHSGERHHFGNEQELLDYLRTQLAIRSNHIEYSSEPAIFPPTPSSNSDLGERNITS